MPIIIKEEGKILTASSKPWEVDGRKGISYKVRVLVGSEIFNLFTDENHIESFREHEGEDGEIQIRLTSPKENPRFEIIGFSAS